MAEEKDRKYRPSAVIRAGAVSFVFLIVGYQASLFINRAARLRIESLRDHPDTVYVIDDSVAMRLLSASCGTLSRVTDARGNQAPASADIGAPGSHSEPSSASVGFPGKVVIRSDGGHSPSVESVRRETRRVESFRFNPNTVSVADLQRLGFSEKQALSIENYREKGGRFRRKSDFARSFVVADSVYQRLEPFIDIPLVDINAADSAAFDALPGIGGWFASKMVSYRSELGGYSRSEQLMDIYRFDREKFDGLKDLIVCRNPNRSFGLWTLPADSLRAHPYVRSWQTARSIVFYREHNPKSEWTPQGLAAAGIITAETAEKLSWCSADPW